MDDQVSIAYLFLRDWMWRRDMLAASAGEGDPDHLDKTLDRLAEKGFESTDRKARNRRISQFVAGVGGEIA